jgi:molybdate transport repressor ModE-like protein
MPSPVQQIAEIIRTRDNFMVTSHVSPDGDAGSSVAMCSILKALGMSYRAAWGRIKRTEEALGEALLAKASGRKGYELTPLAETLLKDFALWHQEVEAFALERAKARLPWDVRPFPGPVPAEGDEPPKTS